jgi:hypothetical protein
MSSYPPYTEISGKRAYAAAGEIAFRVTGSSRADRVELTFRHRLSAGRLVGTVAATAHDDAFFEAPVEDGAAVVVTFDRTDVRAFADALTYIAGRVCLAVAIMGREADLELLAPRALEEG